MTRGKHPERLLKLSATELARMDLVENVRGWQVLDKEVEEVGVVEEVLIDNREAKARFLEVASRGIFRGRARKFLIPIDAIMWRRDNAILLNQTRHHVAEAPPYDPSIVDDDMVDQPYFGDVYDHYGQKPYWIPGYSYPFALNDMSAALVGTVRSCGEHSGPAQAIR